MPVIGPRENDSQVEKAYNEVLELLLTKYKLQQMPLSFHHNKYESDRIERNAVLKEAIRRLFELDSWEGW